MTPYEREVLQEARKWERKMQRKSSMFQKASKSVQTKINQKIPEKAHKVVTESVRKMIEISLTSSSYIYKVDVNPAWDLERREKEVQDRLQKYRHTATIEGAGTGAGGIFLGLADFPMLLSIKMKFLFDAGQLYGLDVNKYEEKMYLLHLFMLAFSSEQSRRKVLERVVNWDQEKDYWKDLDWKELQLEYRDTIDLVKMLQLIPGFGAVVGAWANSRLLTQLGETAMNGFRLRLLEKKIG
ncbi:EcsC family protein [Salinibacillus xinjiangensis]|uniref:EcsC family protein n=1 Tax=Salinibacillus xinjiangensis TaxID=1229268 RepID=A0A6G1X7L6_9BACI|nr:EcsC family protein [Salinibacillus xinjiangensis]MRG86937.1 EcsC family protein [Salinibacillus xinjiangensis]